MKLKRLKLIHLLFLSLFTLILFSGCAVNRGIVDISIDAPANPNSEKIVKIAEVRDVRKFELKPDIPSIPSLKGGEINDSSITSRAIARKRNGYGKALGDILLPEGKTVSQVVEKVLIKALRESGYKVVREANDEYAEAIPIEADIEQFWAYFESGFWVIALHFDANITLTGDIAPLKEGCTIKVSEKQVGQMADTRAWKNIFNQGIGVMVVELKNQLNRQ